MFINILIKTSFQEKFKNVVSSVHEVHLWSHVRGDRKKSGLASELITRVLEQLEPNGQVLRIADNICNILVYIRFLYVEN